MKNSYESTKLQPHIKYVILYLFVLLLPSCSDSNNGHQLIADRQIDYSSEQKINWNETIRPIFELRCTPCHGVSNSLLIWTDLSAGIDNLELVRNYQESILYRAVDLSDGIGSMPLGNYTNMSLEERELLSLWIELGLPE